MLHICMMSSLPKIPVVIVKSAFSVLCNMHKMTILCTRSQRMQNLSFSCDFAANGQSNPYHPIIDISIISNLGQIVNMMFCDFDLKFTFCASRTDICGVFREKLQYMVVSPILTVFCCEKQKPLPKGSFCQRISCHSRRL